MIDVIKEDKVYCENNPNAKGCKIYNLPYINPNELQALITLLKPYAEFLDSAIPKAKFESNADFKKTKLPYIDEQFNKKRK